VFPVTVGAENPPLVVLVHMPKAGGTTLTNVLHSIYGPRLMMATPRYGWRQAWTPEFRAEVRARRDYWHAFAGHTAFGIHALFGRPAIYFSSVRDPVERFLSYYSYVRSHHWHHHHARAENRGPGEFYRLQRDLQDPELYTFQCQLICGRRDFATAREFVERRYSAVAPVSLLGPSIDLIRSQMGWPEINVPFLNRAIDRAHASDMTEADRRALAEGNQSDADLVRFCEDMTARCLAKGPSQEWEARPLVVPATL